MRTIYIIGTVGCMMPQKEMELKLLLQVVDADQIFVQIDLDDMNQGNTQYSAKEMVFAYNWGIQKNKKVICFDKRIDVSSHFLDDNKRDELKNEMGHMFAGTNWKEFNKPNSEVYKKFDKLKFLLADENKERERHYAMLANIEKDLISNGKVLILVNVGHLPFFMENLKEALFPLMK